MLFWGNMYIFESGYKILKKQREDSKNNSEKVKESLENTRNNNN